MTDTPHGALPMPVVPGLTDLAVFARGGYATVYRAVQQSVGREVAVKVENRTLESERDQQRFLREARAAGRMSSHPHVVDLFDAGVTVDQHPYLIMELCEGSYAERMRTSPLDATEARDVGVKIADALADAHQLGVLHRDVKPANILHSRFGEPTLADFGLAVIAEGRDTVTLEVLTPAYAAPEMFRQSPPSPAVDVYALCATLYAVMSGKPPRWKDDRNPSLITLLELFAEPIPELPGIPPALVEVLRLGMANDPAVRPTAEQLRDLLAAVPLAPVSGPPAGRYVPSSPYVTPSPSAGSGFAGPHGVPGRAPSVPPGLVSGPHAPGGPPARPGPPVAGGTRSPAPWPTPSGSATPTIPAIPRRRRWPWFLGGAGTLALVLAVGVGGWFVVAALGGGHEPRPSPPVATTPPPVSPSADGALPGCLLPLPAGGRCPAELECFGPVDLDGLHAERVSCDGRHIWEVYAEGELPATVPADDPEAVQDSPEVQQVCNEYTFRLVTLDMVNTDWRLTVLPPGSEELAGGRRTYRCLAGRGPSGLSGPTITG